MRLAIVGPIHPLRGGIARHTSEMALAARARGHEVRVLSYARLYPGAFFPGRSQFDPDREPAAVASIERAAMIDSCAPWTWPRAAAWLATWKPDVVVAQRWHPFFAPALAAVVAPLRRRGARVVWMVHNARPHEGSALLYRPLLKVGMGPEDVCLTHAQTEIDALRALGVSSTMHRTPHPAPARIVRDVDRRSARQSFGIPPEEIVFLFFGYVRAYKGVDVLLEALGRLPTSGPPWRAVVAGEWYVSRGNADHAIARPPLANHVTILDRYVPEAEAARLFSAADVVVLPYREATQSGVVPLAFAHGRGVICTNVGGLAEAVGTGTGLVVPPEDASALAAALEQVRRGRSFSHEAMHAALSHRSWETFVTVLEGVMR